MIEYIIKKKKLESHRKYKLKSILKRNLNI